jgi:hypothetical protein
MYYRCCWRCIVVIVAKENGFLGKRHSQPRKREHHTRIVIILLMSYGHKNGQENQSQLHFQDYSPKKQVKLIKLYCAPIPVLHHSILQLRYIITCQLQVVGWIESLNVQTAAGREVIIP